jgi:hypothetical protein
LKASSILISIAVITFCYVTNAFALPNQINLQARLWAYVPFIEVGIPLGNGDYLEFGYGRDYNVRYLSEYFPLVYSHQLDSSSNERSALRLGAFIYNSNVSFYNVNGFNGTLPLILYEKERTINDHLTWLFNLGFPTIAELGLKYYL